MENIEEKIKKLLRLAKSDNEYEAKLAIVRARELMAKYKLEVEEFDDDDKQEVVDVVTDWYFTDYKDGYRHYLADALAENYCCITYLSREKGSKCMFVAFRGYENDMKILCDVFKFADDCIRSWFFDKKHNALKGYNNKILNAIKNEYGIGFSEGLKSLLEEQHKQKEQEWGLVMVVPKEARDFKASLSEVGIENNELNNDMIRQLGYKDGYNSSLQDKLVEV